MSLFHPDTVQYSFNAPESLSYENGLYWCCEYADSSGIINTIEVNTPSQTIYLEFPRGSVFPVRFVLSDKISASLRCSNVIRSGFVYPFSSDMKAADSAVSDIFFTVLTGSYNTPEESIQYARCFNWEKLIITLSKFDNPYELDLEAAASDIAHGVFTSKSLKKACLK